MLPTSFTWAGHAHYVHSLWAPHPPCLYIWKGGGRKGTQTNSDARRFLFPLVLKTAFNTAPDIQCSQQPQPPGQERNRPADEAEKTYLHKPGPLGAPRRAGHSKETCQEQGKKKRSSPQEAQRSFALRQDTLQLGRGRGVSSKVERQSLAAMDMQLQSPLLCPHRESIAALPASGATHSLSLGGPLVSFPPPQWSHWLLLPCPLHPCCRYSLRPPFHPACGGGRGAPGGGGGGGAPGGFQ